MNDTRESSYRDGRVAVAVGPISAILVAGVLSNFRTDVGSANVALVIAIIVVLAGLAGRVAGILTALVAGLSYNFFHTEPYRSLRISAPRDVITVCLLVAIGVVVSEASAWRRRSAAAAQRRLGGARALEMIAAEVAADVDCELIREHVQTALVETLDLAECRYEPGPVPSVLPLPRSGALATTTMRFGPGGFQLPDAGVAIPVTFARRTLGHLVLVPRAASGSAIDTRQVAVGLADQLAVSLALHEGRHAAGEGTVAEGSARPGSE